MRTADEPRGSRTSDGHDALRIMLFARPRITVGALAVPWPGSPAVGALLGYLSLHPGELRRMPVAFALWPDEPEDTSRARLRKALFGLQDILSSADGRRDWIVADKRTISWNLDRPIEIDVLEFARSIDDPAASEAALAMYDRSILAGVEAPWLDAKRGELAQRYEGLLERLFRDAITAGETSRARRYAGLLVAHDPLREDMVRELMRLAADAGDRTGALRLYRDFERHVARELDTVPADATRVLVEQIQAERGMEAVIRRSNLPAPATSFVGRDAEVAELAAMVTGGTRLVTVLGPGGVGKSRLALETARSVAAAFPEGSWLAELARIGEPRLVAGTIARAVDGVDLASADPVNALARVVAERRILLVVDNGEHVADALVDVLAELLARCPHLQVVVTSRERLRMPGEHTFLLGTLPTPPSDVRSPEALASYAAIRLFVERAAGMSAAAVQVDETTAEAIASIVRRADGLPLAIELAVPWLRLLSVDELARRLQDRFGVLVGGHRNALPRHQTLEALIAWSYDGLSPAERSAFHRVATINGGFSIAAAAAVSSGISPPPIAAYAGIAALLDKSLLAPDGAAGDRAIMLDALREFAVQRTPADDLEAARNAHAAHVLSVAQDAEHLRHQGADESRWLVPLIQDRHHLTAALGWCLEGGGDPCVGAHLAVALSRFFEYEPPADAIRWYELALQRTPLDDVMLRNRLAIRHLIARRHVDAHFPLDTLALIIRRANELDDPLTEHHALGWLSAELCNVGRIDEGLAAAQRCTDLARRFGTDADVFWALGHEVGARSWAAPETVMDPLREQLQLAEPSRPSHASAATALMYGRILRTRNDADGAYGYIADAVAQFASLAHPAPMLYLIALKTFADLSFERGDDAGARESARTMLQLAPRHGADFFCLAAFDVAARLGLAAKQFVAAASLTGYVAAHRGDGEPSFTAHDYDSIPHAGIMPALEAALDAAKVATLLAAGGRWDRERAAVEARSLL